MKPITRKEYYLAKITGDHNGVTPYPIIREDYYLAKITGDYAGLLPSPTLRIEYYMASVAGAYDGILPSPVTREEIYWAAIAGVYNYNIPTPVTREEQYFFRIAKLYEFIDRLAEGRLINLSDSAKMPFNSMSIFGYCEQSSTPTPESPVSIKSAGTNLSTGKNLFDVKKALKLENWIGSKSYRHFDIDLKPNTTYTLCVSQNNMHRDFNSNYNTKFAFYLGETENSTSRNVMFGNSNMVQSKVKTTYTFTTTDSVYYLYM